MKVGRKPAGRRDSGGTNAGAVKGEPSPPRRRGSEGGVRKRRTGEAPPREARPRAGARTRPPQEPRAPRQRPQTAPAPRPVDRPARPKTTSQAKARIELQADLYASCVLMPRKLVFAAWDEAFPDRKQRVLQPSEPIDHPFVEIARFENRFPGAAFTESDDQALWLKNSSPEERDKRLTATIAALMGCYYGMQSERGAQGVGRATKNSVEAAAVLILAANFLLTGVFFSV